MKKQTFTVAILSMIVLLSSIDAAHAGRDERSRKNKEKAVAWCTNYSRTHSGAECKVVLMRKLCPGGYRKAKRFNKIRSNGYKSCIVGSKLHGVKKAVKKIHKPLTAITKASTRIAVAPIKARADQSKTNKKKAQEWCVNYSRTHSGARCQVQRMIRACRIELPDVGKRFKKFRSAGYKVCIKK